MALTQNKLLDSVAPIYTSVGTNAIVVAYFCNTSNNPITLSLYIVGVSESGSNDNMIYCNVPISNGDTYVVDLEKIILDDGQSLWGTASESDVVVATIIDIGV